MAYNNKNLSLALDSPGFTTNLPSPMTDLTFNMCTLSTTSYNFIGTPKRRISWSSMSPTPPIIMPTTVNEDSGFDDSSVTDMIVSNSSCKTTHTVHPLHHCNDKENIDSNIMDFEDTQFIEETKENDETRTSQLLPTTFHHLLKQPLLTSNLLVDSPSFYVESKFNFPCEQENQTTPSIKGGRSCIRGLFTRPRDGCTMTNKISSKRSERWQGETPIHKRRKAFSFSSSGIEEELVPASELKIHRSHSETEATIMSALQRSVQNPDLIGDFSRPYKLPLVPGKHQDLKSISSETMCHLLLGEYNDVIKEHVVIDCRFPYEYDGGHIQGAKNIFTKEGLMQEFFDSSKLKNISKGLIIIFHCEFSSERGPSLTRFLRTTDRSANEDQYPNLHYPEIYLLSGGYKEFYERCKELCEPQAYKPMLHKDHEQDLRKFRARSKSWQAEHKGKGGVRTGLKLLNQKL